MPSRTIRLKYALNFLENCVRHAIVTATILALASCATLDQVGQQALGPDATSALVRSMSTVVYEGQTWNMSYTVSRTPDNTYYLRKLPNGSMKRVGQFLSIEKAQSIQSKTFATDIYLTRTAECPDQYLLLTAGSNIQGRFSKLGCTDLLTFEAGADGYIYATQAPTADSEPLAYRIGADGVAGPYPVSTLTGYPQSGLERLQQDAQSRLSKSTTNSYSGMVWNFAYTIARRLDGAYVIQKMGSPKVSSLGYYLSLTKVFSAQTKTFAVDAFHTPTEECPYKYLLVIGSANNHGQFKVFGCGKALDFATGNNGLVYATQGSIGGATPLAYTITGTRLLNPEPITELAGYPQHRARGVTEHRDSPSSGTPDEPVPSKKQAIRKMEVPAEAPSHYAPSGVFPMKQPAPVTVDLGDGSSG